MKGYLLGRELFNRLVPRARVPSCTRRWRSAGVYALLFAVFVAGGCRLPAREWRWRVSGAHQTWLDTLGEQRACGLAVRLWVADRTMWPLPLPGSRRLLFGDDDLAALIILDNRTAGKARLDALRVRLLAPEKGEQRYPESVGPGCGASAAPGERIACTLRIAAPRGEKKLELDLTDALPCTDGAFVFRLEHGSAWTWRRVGPGVPGL